VVEEGPELPRIKVYTFFETLTKIWTTIFVAFHAMHGRCQRHATVEVHGSRLLLRYSILI